MIIVPLTARKGVVVSLAAMGRFFYFFRIAGALDRAARRPDRLRNRQSSLAGLICVLARFRTRRGYFPPNRPKRRQTGSQRPRNRFGASLRPPLAGWSPQPPAYLPTPAVTDIAAKASHLRFNAFSVVQGKNTPGQFKNAPDCKPAA